MAKHTETTMVGLLKNALESSIRNMAEEEFENAKEKMVRRLDEKKDEVIASLTLRLVNEMQLNDFGSHLTIRIEKKNIKI